MLFKIGLKRCSAVFKGRISADYKEYIHNNQPKEEIKNCTTLEVTTGGVNYGIFKNGFMRGKDGILKNIPLELIPIDFRDSGVHVFLDLFQPFNVVPQDVWELYEKKNYVLSFEDIMNLFIDKQTPKIKIIKQDIYSKDVIKHENGEFYCLKNIGTDMYKATALKEGIEDMFVEFVDKELHCNSIVYKCALNNKGDKIL